MIAGRDDLLAAARVAQRAARGSPNIPILRALLIEAKDNRVSVSGTDLDVAIRTSVPADTERPLSTAIGADRLYRYLSSLPAGSDVEMVQRTGYGVDCQCGRAVAQLPTFKADEWPHLAGDNSAPLAAIPAEAWRQILAFCSDMVTDEIARPELSGLWMEFRPGTVTAFAGGAPGGATVTLNIKTGAPDSLVTVIPPFTHKLLATLLPKSGDVQIASGERLIRLRFGDAELTTKKLDRDFVEWQRIVPKSVDWTFAVDPTELRDAIGRVHAATGVNGVRLEYDAGQLRLHAHSPDGRADDEVQTADADGAVADLTTGLVPLQAIAAIDALLARKPNAELIEVAGQLKDKTPLRLRLPGDDLAMRLTMPVFMPPLSVTRRAA